MMFRILGTRDYGDDHEAFKNLSARPSARAWGPVGDRPSVNQTKLNPSLDKVYIKFRQGLDQVLNQNGSNN